MIDADKIDVERAQGSFPFLSNNREPAPKKAKPKKRKIFAGGIPAHS